VVLLPILGLALPFILVAFAIPLALIGIVVALVKGAATGV